MNITFGMLTEQDLKSCYDLCQQTFGDCPTFSEVQEVYAACKDDPHYQFIIGKMNDRVVAYTSMILYHNLFDGKQPIASLWYVCVDPHCRRMGVGTALFREIERIAKAAHCEMITFTALSENYTAHRFYESLGYRKDTEQAFVKYLYLE